MAEQNQPSPRTLAWVIVELYQFIVDELDPDPQPIEDYFAEPTLKAAARWAWDALGENVEATS